VVWTFLLVGIHVLLGTLWSLTLIMATRYASGLLKAPGFIQWMDRATGGVFMLFAARLALSSR
jgi:threonine/homoserine/homoserine lactone efflux protein